MMQALSEQHFCVGYINKKAVFYGGTEFFVDYSLLEEFCTEIGLEIKKNEPMSRHTSFKTGGKADLFITVDNKEQLALFLETARSLCVPIFILGKGSNLLVSDSGIDGAVVSLSGLDEIKVEGNCICAGAGASLSAVCLAAANASLSGLEFAYGIPGSVGGALFMNAGAYNGEMADCVSKARYVTPNGVMGEIEKEDMALGYRTSAFKTSGNIITEVCFELQKGNKQEIRSAMDGFMQRRKDKQPLEYPSAGSTFKRPEGYFAGALIEQSGLKGASIGGAQVSEKHAGFVINYDNATTTDILTLMENVKKKVMEDSGVELEPEVIFVGRK